MILCQIFSDSLYRAFVTILQSPAQRISKHLFGQAANKIIAFFFEQQCLEFCRAVERFAGLQLARCVYVKITFPLAPGADSIEILETEADRIHSGMTGGAVGIGAMLLHSMSKRSGQSLFAFFEFRNIRRGGRRRSAQNIFEHPFASLHGRSARWVGSDRQDAGLSQQTTALISLERHPPELISLHTIDSIEMRQFPIQKCVVRANKFHQAAILPANRFEEKLGLLF